MTVMALAPAGIPFAWRFDARYGVGYGLLTYVIVVVMLMALKGWIPIYPWLQTTILVAVTIAVVTLIPIAVLPDFQSVTRDAGVAPVADVRFVGDSIRQIQDSMGRTVRDIQREQQKVDAATRKLIEQIDRQNVTIRHLNAEKARLTSQIKYQQALVSLTREQVDAITTSLSRGKYWDYAVGFILGIISSIIATYGDSVLRTAFSAMRRDKQ